MAHRLQNLKPMPKTILPRLETPEGFEKKKEVKLATNILAPINVGLLSPVGPDLRNIGIQVVSRKELKTRGSTNLLKSYNSLMNKLEPKVSENKDSFNSETPEEMNPLILEEIRSETKMEENPSEDLNLNTHTLKYEESESIPEIVRPIKPKVALDMKKLTKVLEDDPLNPTVDNQPVFLQAKNEDLDEEYIECINISKKDCKVIEYKTGKKISYSKARENTDFIIIKLEDKFYSYSKKDLYEQYMRCHSQMYFHLKICEDSEIFWIPMIQIVRVLEYSHPVYEIEKTKFSMNLYNLKAIKL